MNMEDLMIKLVINNLIHIGLSCGLVVAYSIVERWMRIIFLENIIGIKNDPIGVDDDDDEKAVAVAVEDERHQAITFRSDLKANQIKSNHQQHENLSFPTCFEFCPPEAEPCSVFRNHQHQSNHLMLKGHDFFSRNYPYPENGRIEEEEEEEDDDDEYDELYSDVLEQNTTASLSLRGSSIIIEDGGSYLSLGKKILIQSTPPNLLHLPSVAEVDSSNNNTIDRSFEEEDQERSNNRFSFSTGRRTSTTFFPDNHSQKQHNHQHHNFFDKTNKLFSLKGNKVFNNLNIKTNNNNNNNSTSNFFRHQNASIRSKSKSIFNFYNNNPVSPTSVPNDYKKADKDEEDGEKGDEYLIENKDYGKEDAQKFCTTNNNNKQNNTKKIKLTFLEKNQIYSKYNNRNFKNLTSNNNSSNNNDHNSNRIDYLNMMRSRLKSMKLKRMSLMNKSDHSHSMKSNTIKSIITKTPIITTNDNEGEETDEEDEDETEEIEKNVKVGEVKVEKNYVQTSFAKNYEDKEEEFINKKNEENFGKGDEDFEDDGIFESSSENLKNEESSMNGLKNEEESKNLTRTKSYIEDDEDAD
ncbi:hypothetical protein BY996DRAFT_7079473, partial [Phakopsora pachyrhizi]